MSMSAIYRSGIKYTGTTTDAKNLKYDNTKSGLNASNTQTALDLITENMNTTTNSLKNLFSYNSSTGALIINLDAMG